MEEPMQYARARSALSDRRHEALPQARHRYERPKSSSPLETSEDKLDGEGAATGDRACAASPLVRDGVTRILNEAEERRVEQGIWTWRSGRDGVGSRPIHHLEAKASTVAQAIDPCPA